ncbi:hypothetical protein [Pseudobacillus wudalianchiensis]|nr:hypothetical protein [Bacillus wudalianchiensis]
MTEERHFAISSYACRGSTVGYAFLFCPATGASAYADFALSVGV